jgi:hypothetical protein
MHNRWSLFVSGFVVFATWYVVAYIVTSGTFYGLPGGLAFGLAAIVAGLLFGAAAGVTARAMELHWLHVEVRRGDARDGARVTLGKLPEIVPVVHHDGGAGASEPSAAESHTVTRPIPVPPANRPPECDDSSAPDVAASRVADAPSAPSGDRLAVECAKFVAEHETVAVAPGVAASVAVASIDRATNPDIFAAFFVLINTLAGEGVDVSRVAVSAGPDGLPAAVNFPVSIDNQGALK